MKELITEYLSSMSLNGASHDTIRAYRADLTALADWVGPIQVERETLEPMAKQWMNALRSEWAPTTAGRKLSSLRSFGRYMGWDGFLSTYKCAKPAPARPHPLPEGPVGVLEMFSVCRRPEHEGLVILTGLLGMRISSALRTKWTDFDTIDMVVTVWGKGNKYHTIPVSMTAWTHLAGAYAAAVVRSKAENRGDGRLVPMSDRSARGWITRLGQQAELQRRIASHDMRATAGTAAYRKSKDLRATQRFLGHASSSTTEVYTLISMDEMREAADFV